MLANLQGFSQGSTVPRQITQVVCDGLHAGHKPGSYWLKERWASTVPLSELTHRQHHPLVCRSWTESLCLPEQSSCGDGRWGPATALSSFATAGFPTAAVPAHREATVAAGLISQLTEQASETRGVNPDELGHSSTGCTPEGASCSAPIQARVRLPLGAEAELPSGLVSHLLLLKNAPTLTCLEKSAPFARSARSGVCSSAAAVNYIPVNFHLTQCLPRCLCRSRMQPGY